MNLSGAVCRENFTNDNDWQNYYQDKTNFNEDTIWLNPANGDYIHPEQMEFNIQGLVKKDFGTLLEMMFTLWLADAFQACNLIGWERHLAGIVLKAHLWTLYLYTIKAAGQRIFILIQITVGFCLPLLIICGSYWSLTNVIAKHQDQISQSSDRKKPDMWKKNEQKVNTRVIIFVSACE